MEKEKEGSKGLEPESQAGMQKEQKDLPAVPVSTDVEARTGDRGEGDDVAAGVEKRRSQLEPSPQIGEVEKPSAGEQGKVGLSSVAEGDSEKKRGSPKSVQQGDNEQAL